MMERWLPVVGHEGLYEVSDFGRVKSLARVVMRSNGRPHTWPERILKPMLNKGYPQVDLRRQGERLMVQVHKLVLEAFVGPCPEGMECLHGPGGSGDASLTNVRWGTPVENAADKVRDGTTNRGERCGAHKLSSEQVREIRSRYTGVRGEQARLAREFGVSPMTINDIVHNRRWAYVE